eukprot:70956_1
MSLIPKQQTNNDSICYPIISTKKQIDDSQHPYTQTIVDDSDCKSIKDGCMATHRMINALLYYSTLNIHKSNTNCIELIDDLIMIFKDEKESNNIKRTDKDKFMKYITETYTQFLNDYVHIMDKHNN